MKDKKNICNGIGFSSCLECEKYFSSHSLHYSIEYGRKISTIGCSIGGERIFDENGNLIDRTK
jgi:hypothetical protein